MLKEQESEWKILIPVLVFLWRQVEEMLLELRFFETQMACAVMEYKQENTTKNEQTFEKNS